MRSMKRLLLACAVLLVSLTAQVAADDLPPCEQGRYCYWDPFIWETVCACRRPDGTRDECLHWGGETYCVDYQT